MSDSVRLDKWLWAARFFKTRSLAAAAVDSGKVEVGGQRQKPSRAMRVGDLVTVRKGLQVQEVEVLGLSGKRGSATVAATLYQETAASVQRRQEVATAIKADSADTPAYQGRGRPTKRDRRQLLKMKRRP